MLASVYIKGGNIHFYNETGQTGIGGIAYELGRPLLDFVCYEQERFDDGFAIIASAFDHDYAYLSVREPEFREIVRERNAETQKHEVYIYFYHQMLLDFAMTFVESPAKAIESIAEIIPDTLDKLNWAMDLKWPYDSDAFIPDKDRILYRAVLDVVALISADFRAKLAFTRNEIELLHHIRETVGTPKKSALEYIYWTERYRMEETGQRFYLETPMHSFYGALPTEEVAELYEIDTIDDLLRFEFIEMVKHDIFIKKCKNCGNFFMPKRRVDAEYCDRIIGESKRKCSEIGAVLRYERKVAENPILEAYSKAYKRFNSRTRAKKMTQGEFLSWSEQARKLRDECVAGKLPFEEFSAWLEQGRIRKSRGKTPENIPQ